MRPVPHSDEISASKPPNSVTVDEGNSNVDEVHRDQVGERADSDPTFLQSGPSSKRRFLAEADINDLVGVFNLSEIQAGILASKFKGWNLRQHETKTWYFRYRQNESMHFFTQENSLVLVMMLVLLWRPLDINTLNSGACSTTPQNSS
jgi:hypothetical protein